VESGMITHGEAVGIVTTLLNVSRTGMLEEDDTCSAVVRVTVTA
jgi:hypothetical protein